MRIARRELIVVEMGMDNGRFGFGKNWQQFLRVLDDERIGEAEKSLTDMLQVRNLAGKSFLDIGSGSGLFSLAAMRLGASRVHSLDYDLQSVACAHQLKARFFPDAEHWTIEQGDALDHRYLVGLGTHDVVYSWGVLHHTGNMWQALENVLPLVSDGGRLFIAIYNDAGNKSRRWQTLKKMYNQGAFYRFALPAVFIPLNVARGLLADLSSLKNPATRYRVYKRDRGMSMMRDWIDWIGGWPYEFATASQVADFCRRQGFEMLTCVNRSGWVLGNNEFVFARLANAVASS
ncbi:MAG TPA: class I SAM-dependent methyltransferase [Candidatus Sulfotelmatobacter sp.]|jgi:2-polyprenyl-6-hydroxyphenyl methylase/3-demethylubiquinone-9 3-methyltransferase